MTRHARWYFDFISPYAYLQFTRLKAEQVDIEIEWMPVLFAGLLGHWGHKGPAEIASKRLDTYRFCQWYADTHEILFRMPSAHPFNPLPYLRLCIALGSSEEVIERVFDYLWTESPALDSDSATKALAERLGIEDLDTVLNAASVKATLRANFEQAINDGIYGVPSFVIDGFRFWGVDQTDMMLAYLKNPQIMKTREMQRIAELPTAAMRNLSSA